MLWVHLRERSKPFIDKAHHADVCSIVARRRIVLWQRQHAVTNTKLRHERLLGIESSYWRGRAAAQWHQSSIEVWHSMRMRVDFGCICRQREVPLAHGYGIDLCKSGRGEWERWKIDAVGVCCLDDLRDAKAMCCAQICEECWRQGSKDPKEILHGIVGLGEVTASLAELSSAITDF